MSRGRNLKVLILSDTDGFTLNIMRCLSDLNAECHVFGQGRMWIIRTSKYCRRYTKCDFGVFRENIELLIEKINSYCGKHKISIVLSSNYGTGHLLSRIKFRLNPEILVFPCTTPEILEAFDNKWEFKQMLERNNLPQPRTVLVENQKQLDAVDLGFPCFVKPLRGTGGASLNYMKRDKKDCLASGQLPLKFPLLVQEFVPGKDIDLSILAHQGKVVAWTMQEWINPYTLQFFTSEELLDLGRRVVAAVNYEGVSFPPKILPLAISNPGW